MSKRTFLSRAPLYALLVALVLVVPIVLAATVNFSGALDPATASYARPTAPGMTAGNHACGALTPTSDYGYQAFSVVVDATGLYTLTIEDANGLGDPPTPNKPGGGATPQKDTFMTLYQGSFDPAAPLTNCWYANDDGFGDSHRSRLVDVNLTAGTEYVMVISSYLANRVGGFNGTITGVGTATVATYVPPVDPVDPGSPNGAGGGASTVFVGFNPNDGRINPQAYAPVAIYCDAANSRVAIYGIDADGEGFEAIFVPYSELPETPASNLLIEQFGDIRFYRLSTGEYQVSAGPDAEGKEYAALFDGCPWSYVEAYIFDHLTGMTTLTEVRTR